jgi:uncharacterized protein YjbI with pentapeptide repeats
VLNQVEFSIRCNLNGAKLAKAKSAGCYYYKDDGSKVPRQDYSNRDLTGTDFSNCNLEYADFTNSDLSRVSFEGSNLSFANLTNCFFNETDLRATCLNEANLSNAEFKANCQSNSATNFSDALLRDVRFTDGKLEGNFTGADFSNNKLTNLSLIGANLTKANFFRCVFSNCNLTNTVFIRAKMHEVVFEADCLLDLTNFRDAKLVDSKFSAGCKLSKVNLIDATLDGAQLSECIFESCDLSRVKCYKTSFAQAHFMANCLLTHADFTAADLSEAILKGATAKLITLCETKLTKTDFSYANLAYALIEKGAAFYSVNFDYACLQRVDFHEVATIDELTTFEHSDLSYGNFSGLTLKSSFKGARFKYTNLEGTHFAGDLSAAHFMNANLDKVNFSDKAVMQHTFFDSMPLRQPSVEKNQLLSPTQRAQVFNFNKIETHCIQTLLMLKRYLAEQWCETNLALRIAFFMYAQFPALDFKYTQIAFQPCLTESPTLPLTEQLLLDKLKQLPPERTLQMLQSLFEYIQTKGKDGYSLFSSVKLEHINCLQSHYKFIAEGSADNYEVINQVIRDCSDSKSLINYYSNRLGLGLGDTDLYKSLVNKFNQYDEFKSGVGL